MASLADVVISTCEIELFTIASSFVHVSIGSKWRVNGKFMSPSYAKLDIYGQMLWQFQLRISAFSKVA